MPKPLFFDLPVEKQERILQSAVDEFIAYKDDYSKSSVKRIAARAGIAVGSIYKYFDSKDDIFFYALNPTVYYPDSGTETDLFGKMELNISRFTIESKYNVLADIFTNNIDYFFISFIKYSGSSVFSHFRSLIDGEVQSGKFRDDFDIDQATFLFLVIDSISSLYKKLFGNEQMDNLTLSANFMDLLMNGLKMH